MLGIESEPVMKDLSDKDVKLTSASLLGAHVQIHEYAHMRVHYCTSLQQFPETAAD